MKLNLKGQVQLLSMGLARQGVEEAPDVIATLKLSAETTDKRAVRAALGASEHDPLLWAWGDNMKDRAYIRMGAILTPGAEWKECHDLTLGVYNVRPTKVVIEHVLPVADEIWEVAFKMVVKNAPDGAVEAWSQHLRGLIAMKLKQDSDLLSELADIEEDEL